MGRFSDTEAVSMQLLLEAVNTTLAPQHAFGPDEATRALEIMTEKEELMLSDGQVYRL